MSKKNPSEKRAINWSYWLGNAGKWIFAIAGTAGVGFLLMLLAGSFQEKVNDEQAATAGRVVPAGTEVIEVTVLERERFETAVGEIQPVHQATVAAKILARVVEVNVKSGQAVSQNETLVKLDDQELQARMQQMLAAKDSASAQLEKAQSEFSRAEKLLSNRAISQSEYDSAETNLKTSRADFERATRAIEESKVLLSYAMILAPFDGIVIEKLVDPGDIVTPGQALLSIYDPTQMQLVASVRESLAQSLRVGQTLNASLDSLNLQCLATVSEVVPAADSATRTFQVKVTGPCPAGVYSGMFGRLQIPLEQESILVIPKTAVKRVGQLTMVEVVENNHLSRRSVELGREIDGQWEILSGLRVGERILADIATSKQE